MLKPYGKRIIVEREEAKEISDGGIYIPDTVKEKERPRKGKVLAVTKDSDCGIEIGQTVVFGRYSGVEVDDVLVLKLEDIHAVEG